MTQEELDVLMAGVLDDDKILAQEEPDKLFKEEIAGEYVSEIKKEAVSDSEEKAKELKKSQEYRASIDMAWPSSTDDHKMVYRIDDTTKNTEIEMGEVFDKLEAINELMIKTEESASEAVTLVDLNIKLFSTLSEKFPNIKDFSQALKDNKNMKTKVKAIVQSAQDTKDEVMTTTDIVQYQEIRRKKIERVVNVMRALSRYISFLFENKIKDDKCVENAVFIESDDNTKAVVSNDDIQILLDSLGNK